MKIALISASWHLDLVNSAKSACIKKLESKGINPSTDLVDLSVPGSLEIPLMALKQAKTGNFDGIICFGLITDGGIYRHDFVASAVIDGLMKVQLDTEVPVFSCVLTPHHFHEHQDHLDFFKSHLSKKGEEVADVAFTFINQIQALGEK